MGVRRFGDIDLVRDRAPDGTSRRSTAEATAAASQPTPAAAPDGRCCANRDTPRIVLSRLQNAASTPLISRGKQNKFAPSP